MKLVEKVLTHSHLGDYGLKSYVVLRHEEMEEQDFGPASCESSAL